MDIPAHSIKKRMATARLTLGVLLGSESIFFGTLLVAYLYLRTEHASWPFAQANLWQLGLPIFNTLILLTSCLTAWNAVRCIQKDSSSGLRTNLQITLLLGVLFVLGQVTEFRRSGMQITDFTFGGIYFALIGFHALHVLAGMVVLALNLIRAYLGDFSGDYFLPVRVGSWFWYYVSAVWIVLFLVLFMV